MKLIELKKIIDSQLQFPHTENLKVVVPDNKPSMGQISHTEVEYANSGFDWNKGLFILTTKKKN